MSKPKLFRVTYFDTQSNIRLTNYADTVVMSDDGKKKTLCAIRFGGYPEAVSAMSDAIWGGATMELEVDEKAKLSLYALPKQYRREVTHDGPYAVATLTAEDDAQKAEGAEKEDGKAPEEQPRTNYIFCTPGDRKALFDAVDQKTAVPLIPDYQEYVLEELTKRGFLRQLDVISTTTRLEAWSLRCTSGDQNLVSILEDGLKSGAISIPGGKPGPSPMDGVWTVTQYLNTFGVTVAERIKNLFVPQFDPAKDALSPEVLEVNEFIRAHAGYPLYDAQLAVAEGIKRQLSHSKVGLIVAECGSGKSKIGATAIAAAIAGLRAHQNSQGQGKTFNIVLCPAHITDKWVRELQETVPNTFAAVVRSITEFDRLYALYEKGNRSCYAILSKEKARDGYMHAPAVRWSKQKRGFVCPECGEKLQMDVSKDGVKYEVDADQFYFQKETSENHKCKSCGTVLWTALNPSVPADKTPWVKLGEYGFVYRELAFQHAEKGKSPAQTARIQEVMDAPDGVYPAAGASRAYPLSTYIRKHYKGRIDGLILDELHQYSNKSAQGDAMGELFGTAKKVVGMTATLINGYSSGIFYLLYRLVPGLMKADGKDYNSPVAFDRDYGVIQEVFEEKEPDYHTNRRVVRTKKATRQLPGVSPLVYSTFLLEYAAFLSLSDMGKDLPEYEEIPVPLKMPEVVAKEYERIETALKSVLKSDKKAARKILSAYLNLLTAYPDQPYGHEAIVHPIDGHDIVKPEDTAGFDTPLPKEDYLMALVERKMAAGEKVLIYTNWTRLDTQRKLTKLITEAGYRTETLSARVPPRKREQWVADRLSEGMQVMITNPTCVETGLDLNAFTALVFYDTGFKLFTLRQASRRSWRINQTAPRVEVYMIYYQNTMQHKAMKLMASKLAVAGIIEGNFSEEGLAAMSDVQDMASMMAKELMLGIKDSVEDVSVAFKRMAFLHPKPASNVPALPVFTDAPETATEVVGAVPLVEFTLAPTFTEPEPALEPPAAFYPFARPRRSAKTAAPDKNQITLFELVEKSA